MDDDQITWEQHRLNSERYMKLREKMDIQRNPFGDTFAELKMLIYIPPSAHGTKMNDAIDQAVDRDMDLLTSWKK